MQDSKTPRQYRLTNFKKNKNGESNLKPQQNAYLGGQNRAWTSFCDKAKDQKDRSKHIEIKERTVIQWSKSN